MKREHAKLQEINNIIKKEISTVNDIGVLAGLSGIALFQFYYSRYLNNNEEIYEDALGTLQLCVEKLNSGYHKPTFCSGIAGFGWTIDHLVQNKFIDLDNDELLSDLDEYMYTVMISGFSLGNIDFLHGGMGYGLYFINRYKSTSSELLKFEYKIKINEFISLLENLAEKDENEYKWATFIGNEKVYDLGLAHGLSSIIGILNKLYDLPEFRDRVKNMLFGAVDFINTVQWDENNISLYPTSISIEGKIDNPNSRLAWCYGDLGIAATLLQSSHSLASEELRKKALYILQFSCKRKGLEQNSILDSAICHGAMGIAHIFKNTHNKSNIAAFQDTSEYWMDKGFTLSIHDDGYAGFKKWSASTQTYVADLSLLEGTAGIGLTILSALTTQNMTWDECLLLN
nr:lanthionine synthetase LanC family protein [uncultured Chryseobacterium sp.]